jgi:hypothetical protein
LEAIAKRLSRPGHRISPGHVASALIHEKLQEVAEKSWAPLGHAALAAACDGAIVSSPVLAQRKR